MPRPGRVFEKLIAVLEGIGAASPDWKVSSPAFLVDQHTSSNREIDILLEHAVGNNRTVIAFECKDLKRPVDVPVIESFYGKLQGLEVDAGVIVSRSGFTRPCVPKAASLNVLLHTVESSSDFDWIRTGGILEDIIRFKSFTIRVGSEIINPTDLVRSDGGIITRNSLMDFMATEVLRNPGSLRCQSDATKKDDKLALNSLVISAPDVRYRPLLVLAKPRGPVGGSDVTLSAEFYFDRIFTLFGNFAYRKTEDEMKFAETRSAFENNGDFERIIVAESERDSYVLYGGNVSSNIGARVYRRLISWDELEHKLLEVGPRHHINISPEADLLTFSAFVDKFDQGRGDWDGTNHWPTLDKSGVASVSNYAGYAQFQARRRKP